jgi:AcrR family transcriptional regulator
VSKGQETRGVILDEAGRLARRVGLGGLTIGSLATQTGMSKSGLFAHFGSKESLQLQVLEHSSERFVDDVIRPALKAPRGEPRVRDLFERWIAWDSLEGGCPLVAASFELDDQPGAVRETLVRVQRDWADTLATVFTSGIGEGHFRPPPPVRPGHDGRDAVLPPGEPPARRRGRGRPGPPRARRAPHRRRLTPIPGGPHARVAKK